MNCGKLAHKIALTFKQKAQFLLILPLTDRYFHKREIWAYKKPLGKGELTELPQNKRSPHLQVNGNI